MECLKPISGRYVYVALRIKEKLRLCEVEVFGIKGGAIMIFLNRATTIKHHHRMQSNTLRW